jgi:hypothetical protein
VRQRGGLAGAGPTLAVCWLQPACVGDCRHDLSWHAHAVDGLVRRRLASGRREGRHPRNTHLQREMQLGFCQTAWAMLHRYRSVMVRPGRERLTGEVEVDESYIGGPEPGIPGGGLAIYFGWYDRVYAKDDGLSAGRNRAANPAGG